VVKAYDFSVNIDGASWQKKYNKTGI